MRISEEKRNCALAGGFRYPVLFGILINLLALANCFAAADDAKLIFLGNKNIAPVVYLDNETPSGVAVDIVRALARHMPQAVEIRAMDWTEAQGLVARGDADALIQINETEERRKTFEFSDTLLESQFSIFTSADRVGISGISSLRGLQVGVEAGGLPFQLLAKNPLIHLTIIPNFLEGFRLLNQGSIDAVVVDYRVGSYVIAENKLRNITVSGEPVAFSYSALAVRKGNAKLLDEINGALRTVKADGTYQKILDDWKPKEVVFQTREQITRQIYYAAILVLALLLLVTAIWMLALRKELGRRRAAEERLRDQYSTLRSIIDSADALIFSIDRQCAYTSFNQGHAAAMKALYGAEIVPGHGVLEYMTVAEDRDAAKRNFDRALAGEQLVEEAYSGEEMRSRRYFRVSHSPIRSEGEIIGVAVLAQDITERKRDEEALQRLNRELRAIGECNQTLMRAEDEATLLKDICQIVCDEAGYRMAWAGYTENDDAKTIRPVAWAGAEDGYLKEARFSWADTEWGRGPCGCAVRSGKSACIDDFDDDPRGAPWRDIALARGYRSSIALPLRDERGSSFGILNIYSAVPGAFTADEKRLLEELSGDLAFGIMVLRDRIARKRAEEEILRLNQDLEQRVAERTTELESANKELEAFTYSVSHDLRAPLRHIDGFLGLLKERIATALDEQSRHYMSTISGAALRMAKLIDDLLSFSRMGRSEIVRSRVDLDALVRDVIREFQFETEGRVIDWRIAGLPAVSADRALLRIVFVNLISNALKFTRLRPHAEIEVGSLPGREGESVIFVRDNGAGFDMRYVHNLFGVFQRLHGTDEFEGTGIGLANVRRVIGRHGGKTWAEGKVDGGATFYFSLPGASQEGQPAQE
jgi:PAS domain S-box-containing protein